MKLFRKTKSEFLKHAPILLSLFETLLLSDQCSCDINLLCEYNFVLTVNWLLAIYLVLTDGLCLNDPAFWPAISLSKQPCPADIIYTSTLDFYIFTSVVVCLKPAFISIWLDSFERFMTTSWTITNIYLPYFLFTSCLLYDS